MKTWPASFSRPTSSYRRYVNLISAIRNRIDGYQMERVLISKLEPEARVLAHTDTDGYAGQAGLVRYHPVLQGLPGKPLRLRR